MPNRISYFDVYLIQTIWQTNREAKYVDRLYSLKGTLIIISSYEKRAMSDLKQFKHFKSFEWSKYKLDINVFISFNCLFLFCGFFAKVKHFLLKNSNETIRNKQKKCPLFYSLSSLHGGSLDYSLNSPFNKIN